MLAVLLFLCMFLKESFVLLEIEFFFFLAFYHHSLNVKLLCHIQTIFFKGVPHYEAESFLKKSPVKV